MNILILTHSYPDSEQRWRGTFIQEQARALSEEHDITVVYFKVDYSRFAPFSRYRFNKNINCKVTEYEVTISRSFPVITQLKYLSNTYRFIENEILNKKKIDIIHSHLSYPAGILGVIIQRVKKIPNILTEHTWIKKYFRSRIHKICVQYSLKKSCRVVAVSQALKDDIAQYCKSIVVVIPNVIDVEKFVVNRNKNSQTLNLGLLGGMNNYRKGLDVLLKSVSLINHIDFILHIGGDGIYLNKFKELAKELGVCSKCKFYGEISTDEILKFYSSLDVFILASRDETFGVVVIEAMSCGLPVIATRCGGPQEIITKETGILVDVENPEELSRAIVNVAENLRSYNPDYIREYALTRYGQETFRENIAGLYKEVSEEYSG